MFKIIKNKKIIYFISLLSLSNFLIAGCGGCQINNNIQPVKESSAFIMNVPYSGEIDGFVIVSCGKCNLGKYNQRKCDMSVKIGQMVYDLKGHSYSHDKAHDMDGICNALRVAHISGKIEGNTLIAENFQLIDRPKK